MSYCRFGWDGNNVYVFHGGDGLTCCGCGLPKKLKKGDCRYDRWGDFWTLSFKEMIEHLEAHSKAGHKVPSYALDRLRHERRLFDDNVQKLDYDHPDLDRF